MVFKTPIHDERAKKKVITEISNAWQAATRFDNKGWLWIRKDKLHCILRTQKNKINYILMQIDDEHKVSFGNEEYVRGYKILELIAKEIEENGVGTKGIYLNTSKSYYDCINECDKVQLLRLQYDGWIKEQRKKLKNKRIKKYKITFDELTGKELKNDAEFSHIRSVSTFKHISDSIDNGLIVNKETHKIITARGIQDEAELKNLCIEHDWNIDWYLPYVEKLGILLNI